MSPRIITFDMGGTTAKAGLVENGEVLRTEAIEVGGGVMAGSRLLVGAGYMLKLPAIDLAEVGAGGGSICRLDAAGAPKVGPDSAGADPGPVCYGRGGTLPTITDCNLVLGYLDPGGLVGGALRLDRDAAVAAIARDLAGAAELLGRGSGVRHAAPGLGHDDAGDPSGVGGARARPAAVRDAGVRRQRAAVRRRDRRGAWDRPRDRPAAARRVQRLRPAGRGRRTSRPAEHARAPGSADPARIAGILADLTEPAPTAWRVTGSRAARQSFQRAASARYVGQSSEIEVALPDGDISPATIAAAVRRRA